MHINRWKWSIVVLIAPMARAATLSPLADRLPGTTVVYLGWAGTDALQPVYNRSHLRAVLDDTNLIDVVRQQWPRLRDKVQKDDVARTDAALAALRLAVRHPACVFITVVPQPNETKPDARVGVMIDAGDDADELQKDLQTALPADAPADLQVGALNHVVWLVKGRAEPFEPVHGGADSLAGADRFVASQKHTEVESPVASAFVNLAALQAVADHLADQDEKAKAIWPDVRDRLGLTGVQSLGLTLGFAGSNWSTASFLAASSPRRGLLAAIEPKAIDPILLQHVPADSDDISAVNLDLAQLFDTAKSAFAVDPAAANVAGKVIGAANLFVGRNIRRQLIAPLGPQWAMAVSSDAKGGAVVLNRVNDPQSLQDALTTATYALSNTLNIKLPQNADGTPGAVASQDKVNGLTLTSIVLARGSPSWAIHDSVLAVGQSPDVVVRNFAPSAGVNTAGAHALEAATKAFDLPLSATVGGFSFADLPHSAPVMYGRLTTAGEALMKLKSDFGINLPEVRLPTLDQLKPELSPSMSIDWAEPDGIAARSISPFPGSFVLSSSQSASLGTVGGAALGTSILLPSLNRARETANLVKSAANERQIGQAILLYANEHNGQYPNTLGDLLSEDIGIEAFISPLSNTQTPADLNTPAQRGEWVNQHSDYVFVGRGLTNATAQPDTIVAYEKPGATVARGMNVLYGDGHVQFQDAQAAAKIRQDHPAP